MAYTDGDVVDKDPKSAKFWLRKAADQDYVDAQLTLAKTLLREKTETAIEEVKKWLTRGAALGNANCKYGLELLQQMRVHGISCLDL